MSGPSYASEMVRQTSARIRLQIRIEVMQSILLDGTPSVEVLSQHFEMVEADFQVELELIREKQRYLDSA